MYSRLYYIIYTFFKTKKNHDPEFNTAGIVFIAQVIHLFLILVTIRYFTNFEIPKYSSNSIYNKLAFFPLGIAWLIIVHRFFSQRIEKMTTRFNKKVLTNVQFTLLIVIVLILPLYALIKISGGEVWK